MCFHWILTAIFLPILLYVEQRYCNNYWVRIDVTKRVSILGGFVTFKKKLKDVEKNHAFSLKGLIVSLLY